MNKLAIVINGTGGVGKDTLCDIASRYHKVVNSSAIDPIKDIAKNYGWNGEKDEKSRKFLSDLKQLFINYNDLPLNYLLGECEKFIDSDNEILFVHIREPEEIKKFQRRCPIDCTTLLIRRNDTKMQWNNQSDDNVEKFHYEFYYNNDKPLSEVEEDFMRFFDTIIQYYS